MMMVLLVLTCLVGTAVTGIMTGCEQLFNEDLMEELHEFFAKALQIAIFIHVLAVIVLDRLTRGDLIRAMITGRKRVPVGTEIVDKRRFILDIHFIDAKLLGNDLPDALYDIIH